MKYLIILSLLIIASCTPYRYLDKHHEEICSKCIDEYVKNIPSKDSIKITHDTTYVDVSENIHDTTLVYLKCDSLNNVVLVTVKKLGDSKKVISSYILKNNTLSVINEQLNYKNILLQDSVTKLNKALQVIEKPIIKEKIPFLVWVCLGLLGLLLIIFLILLIKK